MAEEQLKLEAQKALDELWKARRIPFKLTAYRVTPIVDVAEHYKIDFYDSRKEALAVRWRAAHEPFGTAVRTALENWASRLKNDLADQ